MKLTEHDRGGVRAEYSEATVRPILDALRTGQVPWVAARAGGISQSTFNRWAKDIPEFAAAIEEALADCQRGLTMDLMRLARGLPPPEGRVKPDGNVIIKFLERRFPDDWKERTEVNVKVEDVSIESLEQKWADAVVEGEVVSVRALPDAGTTDVAQL